MVFLVFERTIGCMDKTWLTTGETASLLGVSRQHVVDMCERGDLAFTRSGTHRRIRRSDVQNLISPPLTREEEKSLWLHRALLGPLMQDPQHVIATARKNIVDWMPHQRADSMATRYLGQWERVIDGGVDSIATVFTGQSEEHRELRQNSPFAGALSDTERRRVLASFREHWDREHAAA